MIKKIYGPNAIFGLIDQLIEINGEQLKYPISSRRYVCLRITNATISLEGKIQSYLETKKIRSKYYELSVSNIPGWPCITTTNNEKITKTIKNMFIFVEDTRQNTVKEFDDLVKATSEFLYDPGDSYLGMIVLRIEDKFGTNRYISEAPEKYNSEVIEYDLLSDSYTDFDVFIE